MNDDDDFPAFFDENDDDIVAENEAEQEHQLVESSDKHLNVHTHLNIVEADGIGSGAGHGIGAGAHAGSSEDLAIISSNYLPEVLRNVVSKAENDFDEKRAASPTTSKSFDELQRMSFSRLLSALRTLTALYDHQRTVIQRLQASSEQNSRTHSKFNFRFSESLLALNTVIEKCQLAYQTFPHLVSHYHHLQSKLSSLQDEHRQSTVNAESALARNENCENKLQEYSSTISNLERILSEQQNRHQYQIRQWQEECFQLESALQKKQKTIEIQQKSNEEIEEKFEQKKQERIEKMAVQIRKGEERNEEFQDETEEKQKFRKKKETINRTKKGKNTTKNKEQEAQADDEEHKHKTANIFVEVKKIGDELLNDDWERELRALYSSRRAIPIQLTVQQNQSHTQLTPLAIPTVIQQHPYPVSSNPSQSSHLDKPFPTRQSSIASGTVSSRSKQNSVAAHRRSHAETESVLRVTHARMKQSHRKHSAFR